MGYYACTRDGEFSPTSGSGIAAAAHLWTAPGPVFVSGSAASGLAVYHLALDRSCGTQHEPSGLSLSSGGPLGIILWQGAGPMGSQVTPVTGLYLHTVCTRRGRIADPAVMSQPVLEAGWGRSTCLVLSLASGHMGQ